MNRSQETRLKKLGAKLEQVRSRRYCFHYDEVAEAEAQGLMMPAAPSEVTSSGSFRPRLFMSSKNAVTVSASSLEPAIMCSSTRRPSIVKPHAARTGSRLAPGRKRSAMPSTNRYVISYSLNSRCVNAR
jgi:hypothetical protein